MRRLALLLALVLAPSFLHAQTIVSGTVKDPSSFAYASGSLSITGAATLNIPLKFDGTFTVTLNAGTYTFSVLFGGIAPPIGTGPQVCTASGVSISGSSQTVPFTCPALTNIASGGGAGNPASPGCAVQISNSAVTAFGTVTASGIPLGVDSCTSPTLLSIPLALNVSGNQSDAASLTVAGPSPMIDVQAFGARPLGVNPSTTCSTAGSGPPYTTLNCASTAGLMVKDGLAGYAAGSATAQSTPSAPTVTSPVIQGSQTFPYECVGLDIHDGLTAASSAGSVTNAPAVFGNAPVNVSGVTWTGGTVTITTSTTFDPNYASYSANTKHANIVGMGTGLTALNTFSVLIASEPSATSFTFSLAGSGSGTFTGATARAINTFAGTAASRSGQTLTVTTDISSNIQIGPYSNPVIVILTGWLPADINGEYKLSSNDGDSVTGTTITIHRNALLETESATQNGFVTVYEKNVVSCPVIASPTVKYAVYGQSGALGVPTGTYQFLGFTYYDQRTFTDWGYWIRNGSSGVYRPGWLPATPPGASQAQMLSTSITAIVGNTVTISPGASTAVTGATFVHDDAEAIQAALSSIPSSSSYAHDVLLSPSKDPSCSQCFYHLESPSGGSAGQILVVANGVVGDETFFGGFNGQKIKKTDNAVSQYAGEAFGQFYYEPWIGHGNPLVVFTSGQNVIDGIYFGTTEGGVTNDDGQVLVQFDGSAETLDAESEYGTVKDSYFSTGIATTSVGIVMVDSTAFVQIITPTFNSSTPWHQNTSGTINWGPAIGAVELKGDDNLSESQCPNEINFLGQPQFVGKGVLFNGVSCNTGNYSGFSIGNQSGGVDDQQPVTPLVMAEGGVGGPNNLGVYHSTMDSVSIPMVADWGRPSFWTLDSDSVSSGVPLISSSYIGNLTVKDPSYPSGALGQNVNLSLVTPISPTGLTGGLLTSAIISGNTNSQFDNGIGNSGQYPGSTFDVRGNACLDDAEGLTNGNTSGACDSRSESNGSGGAISAVATITVGDGTHQTTWYPPSQTIVNGNSFSGGNSALVTQLTESNIEGSCGNANSHSCIIENNSSSNNMQYVYRTNSSGGYFVLHNQDFYNPSVALAGGATCYIPSSADVSLWDHMRCQNYVNTNGGYGILVGNAGSPCCGSMVSNSAFDNNFTGGPPIGMIGNSSGDPNAFWWNNTSADHPVSGQPNVYLKDTSSGHLSSTAFNHLYEEGPNGGTACMNQISGFAYAGFFSEVIKGGFSGSTAPLFCLDTVAPTSVIIGPGDAPINFTYPVTVFQNNNTTWCWSIPCNALSDSSGRWGLIVTNQSYFDSIQFFHDAKVPQLNQAAASQFAGTATLASGTVTVTFTNPYNSAPVCTANDTSAATAVRVQTTATTATFSEASGTDGIMYICVGNPN